MEPDCRRLGAEPVLPLTRAYAKGRITPNTMIEVPSKYFTKPATPQKILSSNKRNKSLQHHFPAPSYETHLARAPPSGVAPARMFSAYKVLSSVPSQVRLFHKYKRLALGPQ